MRFFHPAPDKLEIKYQNVQTETVKIKDQNVQTEILAQEQGINDINHCFDLRNTFTSIHGHVIFIVKWFFYLQHTYEELK